MKAVLILLMTSLLLAGDYSSMIDSFENGNTDRAIAYARMNATQGNRAAMYNLGLLYYAQGDVEKAQYWLESSVKKGGKGEVGVGLIMFSRGEYSDVISYLNTAASGKIRNSLINVSKDFVENKNKASSDEYIVLGELFSLDDIVRPNNELSLNLIDKAAAKGDTKALELMGDAHNSMRSYSIRAPIQTNSLAQSLNNYRNAGSRGNVDAIAKMGELYIIGPKSIRQVQYGVNFIIKSAHGGSALGAKMLGDLYMRGKDVNGLGVTRDYIQALKFYKEATDICDVNKNLTTALDYKRYYATCMLDRSIIPAYRLLFQEF